MAVSCDFSPILSEIDKTIEFYRKCGLEHKARAAEEAKRRIINKLEE